MKSIKQGGKAIPAGICIGLAFALIICLALAAALASAIANERIQENNIAYFVLAIIMTSTLFGALIAGKCVRREYLIVAGLTVIAYCSVLIGCGILFFNDGFTNVWTSIGASAVGGIIAWAICIRGNKRQGTVKRKSR